MITCSKHAYLSELGPVSDEILDVICSCEDCLTQLGLEMGTHPTIIKLGGSALAEEKLLSIFSDDSKWLTSPPVSSCPPCSTSEVAAAQRSSPPYPQNSNIPKQAMYSTLLGSIFVLLVWVQQSPLLDHFSLQEPNRELISKTKHLPTSSEISEHRSASLVLPTEVPPEGGQASTESAIPPMVPSVSVTQASQEKPHHNASKSASISRKPVAGPLHGVESKTARLLPQNLPETAPPPNAYNGSADGSDAPPAYDATKTVIPNSQQFQKQTTRGVSTATKAIDLSIRPIVRRRGELLRQGPYQPGDRLSLFISGSTGGSAFSVCLSGNKAEAYQLWGGQLPEDGFVPMDFEITGPGPWSISVAYSDGCSSPFALVEMEVR